MCRGNPSHAPKQLIDDTAAALTHLDCPRMDIGMSELHFTFRGRSGWSESAFEPVVAGLVADPVVEAVRIGAPLVGGQLGEGGAVPVPVPPGLT